MDKFLRKLKRKENEEVIRTMAFMSYNPSIGRVLQPGGVKKFQDLALRLVEKLPNIKTEEEFDGLHRRYIRQMIKTFRTAKRKKLSYGQAQKPINVFLKLYVDWAGRPNQKLRNKLLPFLHVPLDSVLMDTIRHEYREWYDQHVNPLIKDSFQRYSLSKINEEQYFVWQKYFRKKYLRKPLLFDIAWSLNREND